MMRIITGTARGTRLATLEGDTTRPTTEMAKEGLFSSIQFELEGRKFLDLFAGSGQMGLEALSRGADSAVFVDASREAALIIRSNCQKTKLDKKCRVINMDVTEYLKSAGNRSEKFHYIYIDPPYKEDLFGEMLKKIGKADLLADGGKIFYESNKGDLSLDSIADSPYCKFRMIKIYKYGKTFIYALGKEEEE